MTFKLETERLIIRAVTRDDVSGIHRIFSNPQVMKFILEEPLASEAETLERLQKVFNHQEQKGLSLWAVVDKSTREIIGDCGIFPVAWKGPGYEIAYHFLPQYWGNGYATEAATECLRYAFEEGGLDNVKGFVFRENVASVRVLEKIGMSFVEETDKYFGITTLVYEKTKTG